MSDWLLPYDGSTWNDFPGEPTIYPEPTGVRQYKFMFDALYIANLNVTDIPEEADYVLDNSHHLIFQEKTLFNQINRELNIPMPREYDYDEVAANNINHPVMLKPVLGKGAWDQYSKLVYRTFPNGRGLVTAFENENVPLNAQAKRKMYFIQEAITEQNGDVNKIHGMVLVNGSGELRVPMVYEEIWRENPNYNCDYAELSPTTRTTHEAICLEYAQKIVNRYDLKNTCLYIQAIVKDGVYYYIDADTRIPHSYCPKGMIEHLPEHLRFMFDAAPDITYPDVCIVRKDLQNMRLSPQYHNDLLSNSCDGYDTFFWIARQASAIDSDDGRYMLLTSGDTVAEATTKLNDYVTYLTVE